MRVVHQALWLPESRVFDLVGMFSADFSIACDVSGLNASMITISPRSLSLSVAFINAFTIIIFHLMSRLTDGTSFNNQREQSANGEIGKPAIVHDPVKTN